MQRGLGRHPRRVTILKNLSHQVRSDTQAALQLYDCSRSLQQNIFSSLSQSNSSINDAVRLYNTARLPSRAPKDSCTVPPQGDINGIQLALQLYSRGRAYAKLGSLERDFAALYIASTYSALVQAFRKEVKIGKSKEGGKQTESGMRGRGSDTRAYNYILRYTQQENDPAALRNLKKANYGGIWLHRFKDVCGPRYPLWMLRPTRMIPCPLDPEYKIRPAW
jgi:hypothetical protein